MANRATWSVAVLLAAVTHLGSAAENAIARVSVTPPFFNPTLGQKATVAFEATAPGKAVLKILDRDRFEIRVLEQVVARPGRVTFAWDGKDRAGRVVPDEAYCVRIDFSDGQKTDVYDPSDHFTTQIIEPKVKLYSPQDGVITYDLPWPARVHFQAGLAIVDPITKFVDGPVLRTIVDHKIRLAGAVVEQWNGYDQSGVIALADLPHFVTGVLATSIPDNPLITVGNQREDFVAYALRERPAADLTPRTFEHHHGAGHIHHAGLTALEDRGPRLTVRPDGTWDGARKRWQVSCPATVKLEMDPDDARYFLNQPTKVFVFLDQKKVYETRVSEAAATVALEGCDLPAGDHLLSVNWVSAFGPSAVASAPVTVARRQAAATPR